MQPPRDGSTHTTRAARDERALARQRFHDRVEF
jgi:hypothetical protein